MKRGRRATERTFQGETKGFLLLLTRGICLLGYEGPHRKLERRVRREMGKAPFAVRSRAGPSFTRMPPSCNASPFVSSPGIVSLDEYKDPHRSLR